MDKQLLSSYWTGKQIMQYTKTLANAIHYLEQEAAKYMVAEVLPDESEVAIGTIVNIAEEGFHYLDETGWKDFPFVYPDKDLDFYTSNTEVGFKLKIISDKFSIADNEDNAMMQWNEEGVTILKDFSALDAPTEVSGALHFRNNNLYLGLET